MVGLTGVKTPTFVRETHGPKVVGPPQGYLQLGIARELNQDRTGALQAYLKVLERDVRSGNVLARADAIERREPSPRTPRCG